MMLTRTLGAIAIGLSFGVCAQDLPKTQFKVIGLNSPTVASIVDEVPFWRETLPKASKGSITADITPLGGGSLVDSEGRTGEKGTYGRESEWCDFFSSRHAGNGKIIEGIALMDHSNNPWSPCKWFTRDYGFMSPTLFNWLDAWRLEAGQSVTLSYRVVAHAGDPREAGGHLPAPGPEGQGDGSVRGPVQRESWQSSTVLRVGKAGLPGETVLGRRRLFRPGADRERGASAGRRRPRTLRRSPTWIRASPSSTSITRERSTNRRPRPVTA